MAIFHMQGQMISRNKGQSAVASAAYRHGAKYNDERIGEEFDYTNKKNVNEGFILAPKNTPSHLLESESLWNSVERSESKVNSQVAREFEIALPVDLDKEQQIALATEYCQKHFVDKGMIADLAFHKLDTDNPHFHVMLTTRQIDATTETGFSAKKERSWNDRSMMDEWRKGWEETTNEHLEKAGCDARIDRRSLKEQKDEIDTLNNPTIEQQAKSISLDRPPTIHVGYKRNPERQARQDALLEVKVSQEAKADSFLNDNQLQGKPLASPAPSPASMDASKGGVIESTAEAISSVTSKAASVVKSSNQDAVEAPDVKPEDMEDDDEYQEYEMPEKEKDPKHKGKDKKDGGGGNKGDGGAKALSDYRDSQDKNLHLTEAQREEIEELEAEEEKVRRGYITEGVAVPDSDQNKSSYYDKTAEERDISFKSKFKSALHQKRSFTEQQFEEERKRYENKGHPKYK